MKKILIIALFLIFGLLPANAENWIQVANNVYIDTDSICRYENDLKTTENYKYSFFEKTINDNSQLWKNFEEAVQEKVSYTETMSIIDIKNKKLSSTKLLSVYGPNEKFILNQQYTDQELEWNDIIPNTTGYTYLKIIEKNIK